jgi:hypothetical protein
MTPWLRRHWRLALVLAASAITFGRSVQFGFSLLDDRTFVLKNPLIAYPFGYGLRELLLTPAMGYPHTVTVLSFAIDRRLFGADAAGYHAVNVATHLGVVTLAYFLLLRLGVRRAVAGTAVALLALHPLVVEPVCWVIGRKDLLATGLLLGALLVVAGGERHARPASGRIAAAVLLCVLAMLAKPSTILAPLLLWPFIRSVQPGWRRTDALWTILPVAVAAVAIAGASLLGLQAQGVFVERTHAQLLVDPLRAATLQLQHLVWPRGLLADYYPVPGDPPAWAMVVTLLAGIVLILYTARRTAPRSVERLAFVLFAITFLPAAGVLPTAHWSADSYFYLPLVWVTLALATSVPRHWPGLAGFPIVAIGLAVLSVVQTRTWAGAVATFEPVVARYPAEPRAMNRLAFAYAEEGNSLMSARTFIEIEERFPDFPFNRGQRASSYLQMGDRARADAVIARCIAERDADCATRFWVDVLNGRRNVRAGGSALAAGTYELAAEQMVQALSPDLLRIVADRLRELGLGRLAHRVQTDARAREAAGSGDAGR